MTNYSETRQRLIEIGISEDILPTEWEPGINLTGADLRWANLHWANLTEADLRRANLTGANLTGANGPFTVGYFGRHHAIAAGGYISIGCERHTYDEWLESYEAIGKKHEYTADEIADYGAWIKLAVARQRRIETES